MLTLYGIPNCDTVKQARVWLDDHGLAYHFHNYKKDGIDRETLERWCARYGHEKLLNTRGTTWRKLPEQERGSVGSKSDSAAALRLMLIHTSLIKRPIIEDSTNLLIGFDRTQWQTLL